MVKPMNVNMKKTKRLYKMYPDWTILPKPQDRTSTQRIIGCLAKTKYIINQIVLFFGWLVLLLLFVKQITFIDIIK